MEKHLRTKIIGIFIPLWVLKFLKKNLFKTPFHKILKHIFEDFIFKTDEFKAYKEVYDKMNRQIDVDAVRHVYTFKLKI